jgi:hypothetical protein
MINQNSAAFVLSCRCRHSNVLIFTILLPGGRESEVWEPSKEAMLFLPFPLPQYTRVSTISLTTFSLSPPLSRSLSLALSRCLIIYVRI